MSTLIIKWAQDLKKCLTKESEPICKAAMKALTQTTDLWTQWKKERVSPMERVARRLYVIIRKIDSHGKFALSPRELSPLYDNLERWDEVGSREGRFKREGTHVYTYGWFMLMYGRNQHNTKALTLWLKINNWKKKKVQMAN